MAEGGESHSPSPVRVPRLLATAMQPFVGSGVKTLDQDVEADYKEALEKGVVPAAYGRLMFLGAGGSGKSSLLDGLMGKPLRVAESTALADTLTVSYQWIKAAEMAEEAWKLYSEEEETKDLAAKSRKLVKSKGRQGQGFYIANWAAAQAVKIFDVSGVAVDLIKRKVSSTKHTVDSLFLQKDYVNKKIIKEAMRGRVSAHDHSDFPDAVMHIWDCGGQPVFLDIISAFLTPRTMSFLLFDASVSLESKYQEIWCHNGVLMPGRYQNITHLQLMMQWLQLIHSSLLTKPKGLQQSHTCSALPGQNDYPRAMLIGTHGDRINSQEAKAVMQSLQSACDDAAFGDLIVDKLIVDNTTAGKGRGKEDPGYRRIRQNIHTFMQSLMVDTPLAWVTFRQVMQRAAVDKPILSYSESVIIAQKCGIPEEVVPSVLQFYHQLGAMLHYVTIQSLSNTVIVQPQWLIDQLRLLLMPQWYGNRPGYLNRFWKWLQERGILMEELYRVIWRDCGLEGGHQTLADVLEHFDLAKKISHCPHDMDFYKGIKYFVPCMLQVEPKANLVSGLRESSIKQAVTLHILFNMGYVPPGFFVRLIARMTDQQKYIPLLDNVVYRGSITFQCNEIDRVIITESIHSLRVNIFRKSKRKNHHVHFADSCTALRRDLMHVCKEVLRWMPSVEARFAFSCTVADSIPEHFVFLKSDSHHNSALYCHHDHECDITPQHKFWLPIQPQAPVHMQIEDGLLTKNEVEQISREIERRENGLEDLVREMEMEYSLEEVKKARDSGRGLAYAVISDYAVRERGTRYKLAQFLRTVRFVYVSQKLLEGEMKSSSASQGSHAHLVATSTGTAASPPSLPDENKLKKQDRPTLLSLVGFPGNATGEEVDIISKIGTHYSKLGIYLLNDVDGTSTDAIEKEFAKDAYKINLEIFKRWLKGSGKGPVTWVKLADVLQRIGLSELGSDISSSLM